jgi:uncharacterized protein Usg
MSTRYTPADQEFVRQLYGERLVNVQVTYFFPDYPSLLQIFLWQAYDLVPDLPKVSEFLMYWEQHIEGPIHSVTCQVQDIIFEPSYSGRNNRQEMYIKGGRA